MLANLNQILNGSTQLFGQTGKPETILRRGVFDARSLLLSSTALTHPGGAASTHHEILVPLKTTIANPLVATEQRFSRLERQPASDMASLAVDRLKRTAATHGITGPELTRLNNAVRFMELHCQRRRCGLWLVTTAKSTSRLLIADIWKRITRLQTTSRLPPYSVITFESRNGLHAHIVFIGTREIWHRLKGSKQFGELIDVRPVTDRAVLVRGYLAKERTPQAGYRRPHMLGGRVRGSHRLPDGGDRVRLSRLLERDAIEAEFVQPWRHTNAKRSAARKPYRPRACPHSSLPEGQAPGRGHQ